MTMTRNSFLISTAIACLAGATCVATTAYASEVAISTAQPAAAAPASSAASPAAVTQSAAADGTGTTTTVTIPNSSENFLDDRVSWSNAIEAKATLTGSLAKGFCIPARTKLIGARAAMDTDVQPGSSPTGSSAAQYQAVTLDAAPFDIFGPPPPIKRDTPTGLRYLIPPGDAQTSLCPDVTNSNTKLYEGTVVYVSSADMDNVTFRSGFDYGALVVPFKMQLSGSKAFTGSASLGGYIGYQNPIGDFGVNVSPILFAGLSNISTSATSGSKTTSQTVAGLSYGTGLLFNIKDSFQAGFVFGFDHVNSAQKYQYNDKPWVSFEIGYSFAN
jgi:hypothetical protein